MTTPQTIQAESWAVALNILWFSSLICSLASASIGILVKQWLHEYQTGISGTSVEIARLRQYRLNHLHKWRVGGIVAVLPVLLQLALALFFSGLLILLWNLHIAVALVASILVTIVMMFVAVTTLLPVFRKDCCYLSPPTYVFFSTAQRVKFATQYALEYHILAPLVGWLRDLRNGSRYASLPTFIKSIHTSLLGWLRRRRSWSITRPLAWRGREQIAIQESSPALNTDMIVVSYSTTMDLNHLSDTAGAILAAPEQEDRNFVVTCFKRIDAINERHYDGRDVDMHSADFWATVLMRESSNTDVCDTLVCWLWNSTPFHSKTSNVQSSRRLFLALVGAMMHLEDEYIVKLRVLWLMERLLVFFPEVFEVTPWRVARYSTCATTSCKDRSLTSLFV